MPIHNYTRCVWVWDYMWSTFCKVNLNKRCLWTWIIHNTCEMNANIWVIRFNELLKLEEMIESIKISFSWLVGNHYWVKRQQPTLRYYNACIYERILIMISCKKWKSWFECVYGCSWEMVECEKRKVVCMHSKGMNVLHCRGLLMVVMIKKITTRRQGTIHCNILAKKSFKEKQLKNNSMKSYSPHWKAQEKVHHFVVMQM